MPNAADRERGSVQQRLHRLRARAIFFDEAARAYPVFDEFQALASVSGDVARQKAYEAWRERWHLELEAAEDWIGPLAWVTFRRHDRNRSPLTPAMLARLWKETAEAEALEKARSIRAVMKGHAAAVERQPFETKAEFLKRARLHSQARAEIFALTGLNRTNRPAIAEHVKWFVRFQLGRESYGAIHGSLPRARNITKEAVRRAINAIATLLGFTLRTARP